MALVVVGKSRCALCDGILMDGDDITAFMAFLPPPHRFGRYSDAAFRRRCFEDGPNARRSKRFMNECKHCGTRGLAILLRQPRWTRGVATRMPSGSGK